MPKIEKVIESRGLEIGENTFSSWVDNFDKLMDLGELIGKSMDFGHAVGKLLYYDALCEVNEDELRQIMREVR